MRRQLSSNQMKDGYAKAVPTLNNIFSEQSTYSLLLCFY